MTVRLRSPDTATAVQSGSKQDAGLWQIYTGGVVRTYIWELHDGEIDVVIDLDSLQAHRPVLPALFDHWGLPIGQWRDVSISAADGIRARLHLYESEAQYAEEARMIAELLAQEHPWEASLGADTGDEGSWERVKGSVTVNGQDFAASADRPLYVLRSGRLFESSVVVFGADSHTGRIAAHRATFAHPPKPQEPTMKDPTIAERLGKLVAKFGASAKPTLAVQLAEGKSDDEIESAALAELRAQLEAKDGELAALSKQLETQAGELAEVKQQLSDLSGADDDGNDDDAGTGTGASASASKPPRQPGEQDRTPTTLSAAMRQIQQEDGKLVGMRLRATALKRYPHLAGHP